MTDRRRERGAAAVEFALVLPLFMAFVFGILEGGRLMEAQNAVTAAARAGAREASLSVPYATVSWLGMHSQSVHLTAKTTVRKED
jgi:Flp pilus assembly protein TadG